MIDTFNGKLLSFVSTHISRIDLAFKRYLGADALLMAFSDAIAALWTCAARVRKTTKMNRNVLSNLMDRNGLIWSRIQAAKRTSSEQGNFVLCCLHLGVFDYR